MYDVRITAYGVRFTATGRAKMVIMRDSLSLSSLRANLFCPLFETPRFIASSGPVAQLRELFEHLDYIGMVETKGFLTYGQRPF
jgi:hypothetical protein